MNVALYLRFSSSKQTEQSIEGQDRVCREFCRREGHKVVAVYADRAASASKDTEKRVQFLKMIKDSEKKKFQAVVVYALDRFARNRFDAATYKQKLKSNGVSVISATENISTDPEGVILEAVLEGMAEYFSLELSKKVTRGMRESAHKGQSTGGRTPLGYRIEDKKIVLDERTAPIVKEIFTRYVAGEPSADITADLNRRGYKTAGGNAFNKSSIVNIISNVKYKGEYHFIDISVDGAIPPIVDEKLFEMAQERKVMNKRHSGSQTASERYLLTGKLFCGHCGRMMTGESGRSANGETYRYYSCPTHKLERTCDKKPVRKDVIEPLVIQAALNILTDERIDLIAEAAVEENEKSLDRAAIAEQEEIVKDLETRIANLQILIERHPEMDDLVDARKERIQQKKDAEKRIYELQHSYIPLNKFQVIYFLEAIRDGDLTNERMQQKFVDTFVNSVTIFDDPDRGPFAKITYNLTDKPTDTVQLTPEERDSIRNSADLFALTDQQFTKSISHEHFSIFVRIG